MSDACKCGRDSSRVWKRVVFAVSQKNYDFPNTLKDI